MGKEKIFLSLILMKVSGEKTRNLFFQQSLYFAALSKNKSSNE
jgi:hypothetical protein